MNYCPTCSTQLVILQESFHALKVFKATPSERTGEIRGCRQCNVTYYFGQTRADQEEHWMATPYKFQEFSRANTDWDAEWRQIEKKS